MQYFSKHKISNEKIFVIRLENIADENWPEELKDESNQKLRGIKLYDSSSTSFTPFCWPALNSHDLKYGELFSQIRILAEQIVADMLKEIKLNSLTDSSNSPTIPKGRPKIFLAPNLFNRDANEIYRKLKKELNTQFQFVPSECLDEYEKIIEYSAKEIKNSDLFIQVLGKNNEGGLTNKLSGIASDARTPMKYWIEGSINIESIENHNYKNWVCSQEYKTFNSVEAIIKDIDNHFGIHDPKPFEEKLDIYLRPESVSLFQFTDMIRQKLLDLDVRCYVLSPKALEMKEYAEEEYITFCDAYMIIRSEKETNWILNRLRKAAYYRHNNRQNLKNKDIYISIIDAPPPPAASQFDLDIKIFDCTSNDIDDQLVGWVNDLKQKLKSNTKNGTETYNS